MKNEEYHEKQTMEDLQSDLGYHFSDLDLPRVALTHASFAYEAKDRQMIHNERLEFLGDGILDFVIAEALYLRVSNKEEGYLSQTRALIVCEASLARVANQLKIGQILRFGKGEAATGGAQKPSNIANAMEALFAAVYLDGGFEVARRVILSVMDEIIDLALSGRLVFDHKSRLIECVQAKVKVPALSFDIIDIQGPVHDRTFVSIVTLNGQKLGQGSGKSKKQAEQNAAKDALDSGVIS